MKTTMDDIVEKEMREIDELAERIYSVLPESVKIDTIGEEMGDRYFREPPEYAEILEWANQNKMWVVGRALSEFAFLLGSPAPLVIDGHLRLWQHKRTAKTYATLNTIPPEEKNGAEVH